MGERVLVENTSSSLKRLLKKLGMKFTEEVGTSTLMQYRISLTDEGLHLTRAANRQAEKDGVRAALFALHERRLITILDEDCSNSFKRALVEIVQ